MTNRDKFVWQVLAMIGLNFINHRFGICAKCFRLLLMVLSTFSLIYFALMNALRIRNKLYKEGVSFLLLPLNSALIWYSAYSRKREISAVVLQIHSLHKKFKTSRKSSQYLTPFIIIALIIPYIICSVNQKFIHLKLKSFKEFTFDYEVSSMIWKKIIVFYANISFSVFCVCFPFSITFSFSVLFHRCSDVLLGYNRILESDLKRKINKNLEILKEFFDITNAMQNLNEQLKNISFFIIFYGLEGFFTVILKISIYKFQYYDYGFAIIEIYHMTCCILIVFSYTVCSSSISENIMKVKRTAKKFLNNHTCGHFTSQRNIYYLKRIENEDVVYLSVCGLICLKKGFLLSALGAIFTYGLLIINLNL